ncbi:nuclease-related domain-containing protein [Streptomyces sp. SID1034]|uniref:nuclease-related domain-containing protein n=1 Tax=Streptomyces sp. SID1034 TaxID=2690248 RepID=UPI0013714B47|nr:nuclease-related domain-containing protein [Streptomyces sp. SID1034]MYV91016.1 NERD domain-containing protein [Streptomyces sp. SID1034]
MGELRVSAWKAHGHDRLYVNRPDGTAIAWFDRKTGHIEIKVPELREAALEALTPHLTRPSTASPSAAASAAPSPVPVPPPQYDLARVAPGSSLLPQVKKHSPGLFGRVLAWSLRRPTPADSWRRGRAGELIVGRELKRLSRHGWYSLHSIMISPTQDIDHLLIGPAGVFTINTKNHSGMDVWVGNDMVKINHGESHPYVRKSRSEAARVARILERGCGYPVVVKPLLVFVKPARLDKASSLTGVRALCERDLAAFGPLSGVLRPEQVEHLYAVARDRRNWPDALQG